MSKFPEQFAFFQKHLGPGLFALMGILFLSLLSIGQKAIIQAPILELKGFLVPVLFGGFSGFIIGFLFQRLNKDFQQRLIEQDESHRELVHSEEKFRLLAENARDVIFRWLLNEKKFEYISPAIFSLSGYPAESFLKDPRLLYKILHPEDRLLFSENSRQIEKGQLMPHQEFRIRHRNGDTVWINQRHTLGYNDQGKTTCLEGICTDISEFRAAQKERTEMEGQLRHAQKIEAVGRLAGGIAHDFNNLLTVINGYSSILLEDPENLNMVSQGLKEIQKAGSKATDLTGQLLNYSRKQVSDPEQINPVEKIQDSIKMMHRLIGEDITMNLNLDPETPNILMDSIHLDQILLNLLTNARDAMPDGGHLDISLKPVHLNRFRCKLCHSQLNGDHVALTVADNGPGIEPCLIDKVFDPFFTTKEPSKGTGLGLATVEGIIHQNNGHIQIESTMDQGSVFTIILPSKPKQETSIKTESPTPSVHLQGKEVLLIVEDEEMVLRLTSTVLKQHGYEVLLAENAEKAQEVFAQRGDDIALVLSDVVMPGMNGILLADLLCKKKPELEIVLMSGYVGSELNRHKINESEYSYLKKPFGSEALVRTIRQLLDNREQKEI
ncbi:MAG: response regulator [bacterium]|nr:response regulator [bacterium]